MNQEIQAAQGLYLTVVIMSVKVGTRIEVEAVRSEEIDVRHESPCLQKIAASTKDSMVLESLT